MWSQILSCLPQALGRRLPLRLGATLLALGLAACSGGGYTTAAAPTRTGCTPSTCGAAVLTLSDAAGDFTSYTVDVTSLKLTRADGAVVETLPAKTRIDFAQLVNLTEFLTSTSIPNGDYVSATMTVDYTNAAVYVDNGTGTPVLAALVDGSGKPLTTLTLTVQLDNRNHLVVAPGRPARLALDFNLTASNSVDLTNPAVPVVTVKPLIVATVVPIDTKELRLRGTLVSTDQAASTYKINVRPFREMVDAGDPVVVHTTATTAFEINGTASVGAAGLMALAALPAGSLTVAFGTISSADESFTAVRVLAATSVDGGPLDRLHGTVISRTGDSLLVRSGWILLHGMNDDVFSPRDVTLTIADTTVFTVAGQPTAKPTKSWPSIGSQITAFGTDGTGTGGNPTFDATSGRLRLELTSLSGVATATGSAQLTLRLQSLGERPVSVFNFAGTGQTSLMNSNPASYIVTTGTLPLTSVGVNAPLRMFGFVQPFGTAPPDFNARTLADFSAVEALLDAGFGAGSTAALASINSSGLVLNLSDPLLGNGGIRTGPVVLGLKTLASNPTLVPDTTGPDLFAIRISAMGQPEEVEMFNTFTDFETALAMKLNGTVKVERIYALGHYDAASNTFTARQIAVILQG